MNRSLSILCSCIIGLILIAPSLRAQNQWTPTNGPWGGIVACVAVDQSNGTIFVGAPYAYVYRSTNNGATWTQVKSGMWNSITYALHIDQNHRIYAGGYGGVAISSNNGDTWNQSGLQSKLTYAIVVDPDGRIFAGAIDGIYRSTDNGTTFTRVALEGSQVNSLTVKPNGDLFAGVNYSGAYRSTDHGNTWTQQNSGLSGLNVSSVVYDPSNNSLLCGSDQVYRSTDNGSTWTGLGPAASIYALYIDQTNHHFFAVTWLGGVQRSMDNGATWQQVNTGLVSFWLMKMSGNASGHLFLVGYNGVYRSTDNGAHWIEMNTGIMNTHVVALARSNRDYLFAGTDGSGIFRSTDLGQTWDNLSRLDIDPYVSGVAVTFAAMENCHVFQGTAQGIYRSTDRGNDWTKLTNGIPQFDRTTCLYSATTGYLYAGLFERGLFRSSDDGTSWTRLTNGLDDSTFFDVHLRGNQAVLMAASLRQGIFFSSDDGDTWEKRNTGISGGLDFRTLHFNVGDDAWYAAGYSDSLYRSTDNGMTWTSVHNYAVSSYARSMAAKNDGEMFIGLDGNGLYKTTNSGTSWQLYNNGMESYKINSLLIGNLDPYLFAGTANGVYRTAWYVPVELQSFDATMVAGSVLLRWTTIGEKNNLGFAVERKERNSASELNSFSERWENIGFVHAAPSGKGEKNYSMTDDVRAIRTRDEFVQLHYRLKQLDLDGSFTYSHVVEIALSPQSGMWLSDNYPNPVRRGSDGRALIQFSVPSASYVTLKLHDALGREVKTLAAGSFEVGAHSVSFDISALPNGVYFYRLLSDGKSLMKRMVVGR